MIAPAWIPRLLPAAIQALRLVPVLLVVLLSAPGWLAWPFLPRARQTFVLEMVKELIVWTYGPDRDQHQLSNSDKQMGPN